MDYIDFARTWVVTHAEFLLTWLITALLVMTAGLDRNTPRHPACRHGDDRGCGHHGCGVRARNCGGAERTSGRIRIGILSGFGRGDACTRSPLGGPDALAARRREPAFA